MENLPLVPTNLLRSNNLEGLYETFCSRKPCFVMDTVVRELSTSKAIDNVIDIPDRYLDIQVSEDEAIEFGICLSRSGKLASLCVLLDLVAALARKQHCANSTRYLVLENAFELMTLDNSIELWKYVESRKDLTDNLEAVRPPGTILLRLVNVLLSRLSNVQHSQLIARINGYVSIAFGPFDRLGVNSKGLYSVHQIKFADSANKDYRVFWSLQNTMQKPAELLNDESLGKFLTDVNHVRTLFDDRMLIDIPLLDIPTWNTDPAAFGMVLRDKWTWAVLSLQVLFLLEFVRANGSESLAQLAGQSVNKAVLYDYMPSDELLKQIRQEKVSWYRINIKCIAFEDREIVKQHVLDEQMWAQWKLLQCASDSRVPNNDLEDEMNSNLEKLAEPRPRCVTDMGNEQLSRLWKTRTGIERFIIDADLICNTEKNHILPTDANKEVQEARIWRAFHHARETGNWSAILKKASDLGSSVSDEPKKHKLEDEQGEESKRLKLEEPENSSSSPELSKKLPETAIAANADSERNVDANIPE